MMYVTARSYSGSVPKQVSYSEFLTELRGGTVPEVQITERELVGVLKANSSAPKAVRAPRWDSRTRDRDLIEAPRSHGADLARTDSKGDARPRRIGYAPGCRGAAGSGRYIGSG